ncbi:MAG: GH92 family glycosyl hydrolase [Dysgonamonadaceae bacterium]|jgi:predicted alpha-1,2-mannosidase|nr:GH92 family glycosyl hydrolase [Dysgonamonadaceae bacterium]
MKKQLILVALLTLTLISCNNTKTSVLSYVDPFVGTTYTGHTFPGAAYPLGMMQPGPQTGNFEWKYCAGYKYEDPLIGGFTQNRLNGTGIPDMGDLLLMPFSGTPRDDFKSAFSKETEKASPGYYTVLLDDNAVRVELTATPHVALHRYRFTKEEPALYIDFQNGNASSEDLYHTRVLHADIQANDRQTISGYMRVKHWVERDMFFVIQFDRPFLLADTLPGDTRNKAPKIVYRFDNSKELNVKVAMSMVSVEGAKNNMEAELAHWDFDKAKKDAGNAWEELLSRAVVEGSENQKKNFYTSMYHLFIQPNNIADVDGRYRGATDSVALSPTGKYYSTLSLWDTFRAAHPLYTLLAPDIVPDMINSMLLHAETYGYLPIWTLWGKESYVMIGNHGVPPVVEACLKQIPGIDRERAYRAVKQSLTTDKHHKYDWKMYDQYGYFPFDLVKEESASRTLECGYDDYCAALLAKDLGKEDDYRFFMKRSAYWQNLFDPESKLIRAKDSNGKWRTPFDKYHLSHAGTAGGDYTEGNAWQYTWHVLQDIDNLIHRMGGNDAFVTKLDSLFTLDAKVEQEGFTGDVTGLIGQYAQGNEPSHHVIYLYSLAGKRERTAEWVREVFDRFYKPKPDGLCGNDDCGQMSAWYLFSAMGFYPVDPAGGKYVLGAPQLPEITLKLANGKTFTVVAHQLSEANKYVQSIRLNGKEITNAIITHKQIEDGGRLVFEMIDK